MKKIILSLAVALSFFIVAAVVGFAAGEAWADNPDFADVDFTLWEGEEWLCDYHGVRDDFSKDDDYCPYCRSQISLFSAGTRSSSSLPSGSLEFPLVSFTMTTAGTSGSTVCSLDSNGYYSPGKSFSSKTVEFRANFNGKISDYISTGRTWFYFDLKSNVNILNATNKYFSTNVSLGDDTGQVVKLSDGVYRLYGYYSVSPSDNFVKIRLILPSIPTTFDVKPLFYVRSDSSTPPVDPMYDQGGGGSGSSGPMAPPTDSDQWLNEQFSGAVNSQLPGKMDEANQLFQDMEQVEQGFVDSMTENAIDPSEYTLPFSMVNGVMFISDIWTDCFDQLGDYKIILTFPLYIGIALMMIGRLGVALGGGSRMRRDVKHDMNKTGRDVD